MGDRAEERRIPTYDDILALPEGVDGEIIAGELVVSPRPAPKQTRASTALLGSLWTTCDEGPGGSGRWWIFFEPALRLGIDPRFDTVVPDLAGWRVERLPELPDTASFALPPDWVCEVLSAGNAARDRTEKLPFYARAGVSHAWLVDPTVRTLEALRREGRFWTTVGAWRDDAIVRAEPFEALELELAVLWGRPAPAEPKP